MLIKSHRLQRGVSLIELMIGLTLGLIIVAGVVSFIGSLLATNTQTTQMTMLNQELRAVTELIARDLRRARGQADPIANIGRQDDAVTTWDAINAATAGCITYGYEGGEGGAFRAIRLRTTDERGEVVMVVGDSAQTCTSTGSTIAALTSARVDITGLTFTQNGNRVDVSVTGRWANAAELQPRTFSTSVFVRSSAI